MRKKNSNNRNLMGEAGKASEMSTYRVREHNKLKNRATRSTIEVAPFRYFVSERRGLLTPNGRNVNLDFSKKTFCRFGPWDCSPQ